jgi:hypothetical protein
VRNRDANDLGKLHNRHFIGYRPDKHGVLWVF